ncbi:DEAD/DEAH box helicase [Enterococcus sp. AZ062]|uniref:DEAD/DEAH box helicase n=1 Tax=Enterococcus sp. AZ062 TaxID=2774692 RepID=UPI003F291376
MVNLNYFLDVETNILRNEELREPQVEAYAELYNHFILEKKNSHAIVVLPTGVGKTGLMAITPFNISKGRVLIIAPQLTILDTIEASLNPEDSNNFWSKRKVIKDPRKLPTLVVYEGKDTRKDHMEDANIVLVNIQRMQSRNITSLVNQYPEDFFDMIIIDEAHHAEARTWIEAFNHFSNAKVVKITATPYRTDKKELVGQLVYKYKLSQAMSNMYVKSLEKFNYIPDKLYLKIEEDDTLYTVDEILSNPNYSEDWVAKSVSYSDECKISVIKKSEEILNSKRKDTTVPHKIIAAAPNIEEAKHIAELYEEYTNLRAIAVYHEQHPDERRQIFNDIDNHRYDVIVNVSLMGEGYDHKYLSVAAIFRVFKNILPYEQFIGRILRTIPEEEMKKSDDNVGSVVVHQNLNLDDLWDYYKEQLQESEFIDEIRKLPDTNFEDDDNDEKRKGNKNLVNLGEVHDSGSGELSKTSYIETQLLRKRQKEVEERREKINQLISILNVTESQAESIIDEQETQESEFKRPDLLLKQRKKTTYAMITQQIVPEILNRHGLELQGDEILNLPFFNGKYSWIPGKIKNNGGALATYFNSYLKNKIGRKRDLWSNDDYARAAILLDQQQQYVDEYLKGEYFNE